MSEVDELISHSSLLITTLIKLFKQGEISYDIFDRNTRLKVSFLRQNINNPVSPAITLAKEALQQYEELNLDTFTCNTEG